MPLLFVLIVIGLAGYAFLHANPDRETEVPDTSADWERAALGARGLDQILLKVAKPLAGQPTIYERSMSPTYRTLQSKLLASGGLYAGSVEVFLSVQIVALIFAAVGLGVALSLDTDMMARGLAAMSGFIFAAWPYGQLNKASKARVQEINATLPAFADLLQMPLSAGMGVLPAISFTVERIRDGVVKEEVVNMLNLQKSRAVTDAQAFMMAGERLGTAEAKAFFTALMQAHTQGMRVAQNIEKQAEALRDKAFEQRREQVMKLPTKISVALAMHLMPMVLIVTMMPVALSLGNI